MRRLMMGATAVAALLMLLSGCTPQPAPPAADEAARQSEITRQGLANGPAATEAPVGAPAAPAH